MTNRTRKSQDFVKFFRIYLGFYARFVQNVQPQRAINLFLRHDCALSGHFVNHHLPPHRNQRQDSFFNENGLVLFGFEPCVPKPITQNDTS
jgi:hypothetical protein